MEREYVRNRFEATLLGMAIGDAMGSPVIGLSPYMTLKKYQIIDAYYPGPSHKTGQYSTCSKSAFAIARSIAENYSLDHNYFAKCMSEVDENEDCTKHSVEKFKSGIPYESCGATLSMSPNFLLKMIPIGLWAAAKGIDEIELLRACRSAVVFTNQFRPCTLHGYIIAKTIRESIRAGKDLKNPYEWYQGHRSFLARLIDFVRIIEAKMKDEEVMEDDLSTRLDFLRKHLQKGASIESFVGICGNSGSSMTNACFSLFCFLKSPDTFMTISRAVTMGGDSHINGGLVGGMVGAYAGMTAIKDSMRCDLVNHSKISNLSEKLMDIITDSV